MIIIQIVNIAALVIIPIISVWIAHHLQIRSAKRKDKMDAFKVLMTSRIYGWTPASVDALNTIDVVFVDDQNVRNAWADLNKKYHIERPSDEDVKSIEKTHLQLLQEMANSLGYKGKISWETVQEPYMPNGMVMQIEQQKRNQQLYFDALSGVENMIMKAGSNNDVSE